MCGLCVVCTFVCVRWMLAVCVWRACVHVCVFVCARACVFRVFGKNIPVVCTWQRIIITFFGTSLLA